MGFFYEKYNEHKKDICFVITGIFLFIFIKYMIAFALPFILSFLYVYAIRKPIEFLHKRTKIGKGFLAGLSLFFLFSLLAVGMIYGCNICFCRIREFIAEIGFYKQCLTNAIHSCCLAIEKNIGVDSAKAERLMMERADVLIGNLESDMTPQFIGHTFLYGKWIFQGFMFVLITIIASVLLAQDYKSISEKTRKHRIFSEALEIARNLLHMIGAYLKAQAEILLIISLLCFCGFLIAKFRYPYVWAVLTGILDALPFIGTALVLLPLAIIQLLMGNEITAAVLFVTYLICALTRELLEPKLVGKKIGIYPIFILASVYIGIKVFGAVGVLCGPLYLLTLFELYKRLYH